MTRPVAWLVIEEGWAVHSADGERVGRVEEVLGVPEDDIFNGLVVATGFFSARYVPAEHVREILERRVHLDLTKDAVERLPDRPPV